MARNGMMSVLQERKKIRRKGIHAKKQIENEPIQGKDTV